ncbi:MAG: SH3 domain-containing protein, partial [Gallionellaceae bacterium]
EAFGDAKLVGKLKAHDKVRILAKDGGWLKIKSARGKGWVRMLSIRKGNYKKTNNEAKGLLSMASGRAGTGKVVASTGIRGLGEEELKAAKFNAQEMQLAESYSVSKAQAQQFANAGKLVARKFDYLPEVE